MDYMSRVLVLLFILCQLKCSESSINTNAANIVILYQEQSPILKVVEAAIKYINQDYVDSGFNVDQITKIPLPDNEDAVGIIKSFCDTLDELNRGVNRIDLVLDFITHGVPSEATKVILKVLKIPTVSATFGQHTDIREWRYMSNNTRKILIQVSPPGDILIESVRGFAIHQNMTTAGIFYDDNYQMSHKYPSLLRGSKTKHIIRKVGPELETQLKHMMNIPMSNYFIAGSKETISTVLSTASKIFTEADYDKKREMTAWYSMSLNGDYPDCTDCATSMQVHHMTMQPTANYGQKRRAFAKQSGDVNIDELNEPFIFDLTVNALNAVRLLKAKGQWKEDKAIFCGTYNYTEESSMDQVSIDLMSEFQMEATSSDATKGNILGPFHIHRNGMNYPNFKMNLELLDFAVGSSEPSSKTPIGEWAAGLGNEDQFTFNPGQNLTSFSSHSFYKIVTYIQPPFVYKHKNCSQSDDSPDCYYGYCIDMLKLINKDIPFDYTIRSVDKYGFMAEEGDNEWDGMVGELVAKRADIALGAFKYMPERGKVIDVTIPFYELVGNTIIMRIERTKFDIWKFLTVLESEVWYCILGAYFFTCVIMWFFERFSPYSYRNDPDRYKDDDDENEPRVFTAKESLWFCMTSLTPQGGGAAPKNLSGRLVAATWWLFGFIILASYTANLAAFLTVSRLEVPISNLDLLTAQYRIHYSPVKDSPTWQFFDRMAYIEHRFYEWWKDISLDDELSVFERSKLAVWNYPVSDKYTKIWQAMQENKPPATLEDAIARIIGNENSTDIDGFALITEANEARYQVMMHCELRLIGEPFSFQPYVIGLQKGSPLKDDLSRVIAKLEQSRDLEGLKVKWWDENPHKPFCPKVFNVAEGIPDSDMGGIFIVTIGGSFISFIVSVIEGWYYKKYQRPDELLKRQQEELAVATGAMPVSQTDFTTEFAKPTSEDQTNFKTEYDKPTVKNMWT